MAPADRAAVRQRLQRYMASLMVLRQHFPTLYTALYAGQPSLAALPEWQALVKRSDALQAQGAEPVLVAVLYGPTGAGKSTLFRLLTGVQVPAGDSRRPMSYTCTLAVPEDMAEDERVQSIFPHFRVQRLQWPEQLRQRQSDASLLLYTPYAVERTGGLPLVLADVPDFDSVAQDNWVQAEAMLERAELVVFLVYGEAYANDVVVQALARGCRLAAQLVYVFTKTPSAQVAQEKWQDLLEHLRCRGVFQEKRADGQTLLDFLHACPVYYSPRRELPSEVILADLQPVFAAPSFAALLHGLDADTMLFAGLAEPTRRVVDTCRQELQQVHGRIQQLQADLASAAAPLHDIAAKIAASEFPISRLLELVMQQAVSTQSRLRQMATTPFRRMNQAVSSVRETARSAGKALVDMFRVPSPTHTAVRPWLELEQERLHEGLVAESGLFHLWRQQALLGSAASQSWFTQERLETLRTTLQQTPIPPPAQDWEVYVRQEISAWAQEHPWLCALLPGLGDLVAVLGGAVFVVDLCTTGGLFGTAVVLGSLGTAGTAAVGGSAMGIVMNWLTQWHLEQVVHQAQERWRQQRTRELQQHLERHVWQPLFQPWIAQLHALQHAPVALCQQACDDLDRLLQELRVAHRS